ncbi:hypothetical protein [Lichenibacterium dinghuense]|uniref:hypothetical protein n=1 Tax=Lichenibacterium dinghuense TaxID=2895977 RepID=UPI001F198B5E|nr:hypothetical protein [Lichenibacterium sp. 6Y81]
MTEIDADRRVALFQPLQAARLGAASWRDRAAVLLPERAGAGLVALATALAVALYLWRSGQSAVHPQLISEDGRVFFVDAKLDGLGALVTPYAGYLHVLPRLAALATSAFPSPRAPVLYLLFATAAVAWAAATVASTGQRHAWVLAPLMLLPPTYGEVFGTLTNIQWLTGPALALVLATPAPPGRLARGNQLAFVAAASLTGPFSIFAAPLALWRLRDEGRDGFARLLCILALCGAAVQIAFVAQEPKFPAEPDAVAPLHFAATLLDRWIGQAAHAGRTLRPAHVRAAAALAVAAAVAACSVPRLAARLYLFAGLGLLATFLRFIDANAYFDAPGSAERYFYGPRLVVLWTLALCLLRLRPSSLAGLVGVALMLAAVDPWIKLPYPRLPWAEPARAIDRGAAVRIVINPSRADDDTDDAWTVTLPARPPGPDAAPPR